MNNNNNELQGDTSPQRAVISVHTRGFGFATPIGLGGPGSGAFVAPPDLSTLLSGDTVECTIETAADGRTSASNLTLVDRWRTQLMGRLVRDGATTVAIIDPQVSNHRWPLSDVPDEVPDGAWVVGALPNTTSGDILAFDRVVPDADFGLHAVLVRWGVRPEHDEALRDLPTPTLSTEGLRDLRDVPTVTIDAPYSRDLDDAVAVLGPQSDGALRLLVMIADVDAAVPENSPADLEARRRMTTVYLPDANFPMIPRRLSEDALSLLPGQDRRVLACELRLDADGEVTSVELSNAIMRSDARLSYDAVAAYLDEGDAAGIPEAVQPTVRWLRTVAARIGAARAARGGISLERDELHLTIDRESGEPTDVVARSVNSAHKLIERLMVAANEAVAGWLVDRGLPGLFRVQDEPDPERVADLATFARNFGFETAFPGRLTPRGLAAFETQFAASSVAPQVRTVLRRILGRARYTVHPSPHFGLAAPMYVHFTSPIRRYPDLVVHRIIKAHLAGHRELEAGDPDIERIGQAMNEVSGRARRAEIDRQRALVARLFASRLGQQFDARIVAIKSFGVVVQLDGTGVSGMLMASELPGGPFRFDAGTETLVGRDEAHTFSVGRALRIEITGADEQLGRLELGLVRA